MANFSGKYICHLLPIQPTKTFKNEDRFGILFNKKRYCCNRVKGFDNNTAYRLV